MKKIIIFLCVASFIGGCGNSNTKKTDTEKKEKEVIDPMKLKGIGPIQNLKLSEGIDKEMVEVGKEIFEAKCTACHKTNEKFIGPAPKGILKRRSPEWIMNMILNPEEMVKKDPVAKELLIQFNGSPMANQNLTEEEARNVLEFFRTL